jgi:hypothetical protein
MLSRGNNVAYFKTIWKLARERCPRLPVPSKAEQVKIRNSLGMARDEPFMRCRGKLTSKVKRFEQKGDFSHSGPQTAHVCNQCRCNRVAGWGTTHYGVGYCWYHDIDSARRMAKAQTIALRQGYPLDPIKYHSDSEYIDEVRKMADDSGQVLGMRDELILLRTHLQEFEKFWREADPTKQLTMKTAHGAAPMTDDIKLSLLVKLTEAVSKLSRDQFLITESDFVSIDEVKTWFWSILQALERNWHKFELKELSEKDFLPAMLRDIREIPQPKTGRRKK